METALELDRQAEDLEGVSNSLALLAIAAAEGGLAELDALGLLRQSAALARDLGHAQVLGNRVIPAGARLLLRKGDPARALTALALGRAMAEARGTGLGPLGEALYNRGWDEAVAALHDDAAERAADEGVRRHRAGESDAFVDEMLGALD